MQVVVGPKTANIHVVGIHTFLTWLIYSAVFTLDEVVTFGCFHAVHECAYIIAVCGNEYCRHLTTLKMDVIFIFIIFIFIYGFPTQLLL